MFDAYKHGAAPTSVATVHDFDTFLCTCRGWQTAAAAAPAQKAPPVVVSAPTAEEIDRRRHHRSDKAARLARQREDAVRREVTL